MTLTTPAPTRRSRTSKAVRNAWAISWLGKGIEVHRPSPSTVVYDDPHRRLTRFDRDSAATGNPVLLVPPLAAPAYCYDLRPGQSLATHLIETGRQPYLIDYGTMTFADRGMGLEDWIDDIILKAIERVSREHDGAPVDLVAWSLGGTISLLTAAAHRELPIGSITAIGTPMDYSKITSTEILRRLDSAVGSRLVTAPTAAMGGVPRHLVRASFRATAPKRELTKAWFLARNLANTEALARTEAIDRFMGEMPGYPGRFYHQVHTRLMARLELVSGTVHLSRRRAVELADIRPPVLFIGSATDAIAPGPSVEAGVTALAGTTSVRYAAADGLSHLGLVAGPDASERSWPLIDEFLAANS